MALHDSILEGLQGYSLAKYSTWFYYKPDRLLLDCGEGVSGALQNFIYGVKTIFLSHGHGDHIWGLPGFLLSRASSMGEREKPVDIYFPKGERTFDKLRRMIDDVLRRPPFEIRWHPTVDGDVIPVNDEGRFMRAFRTGHMRGNLCLGANIIEVRTRLKPAFAALPQPELVARIKAEGKDAVSERYEKILLAYSADCPKLPAERVAEAEVLLHEATFVRAEDMEGGQHATVREAIECGIEAGVKCLVLFHVSTRYRHRELKSTIARCLKELKPSFPVYYTFPRRTPSDFTLAEPPG